MSPSEHECTCLLEELPTKRILKQVSNDDGTSEMTTNLGNWVLHI